MAKGRNLQRTVFYEKQDNMQNIIHNIFSNRVAQPRSILVIRLSSMGDVLLTTPLVRLLRKRFPEARLDVCISEEWHTIYHDNPHCTNVFTYKRSFSAQELQAWKHNIAASLLKTTGEARYDLIIDLQRNRRSRQIRRGLGAQVRKIRKYRLHKLALVYLKSNLHAKTIHITERYRETLPNLMLQDDGRGLDFGQAQVNQSKPSAADENIVRIAIAPGAHHATKRWLPEGFAETALLLTKRLELQGKATTILLIGGVADKSICAEVASHLADKVAVHNTSPNTSLAETAQILDSADILLCNDTGVMHLAAARGLPLVAIFGSTVPELGFAPFRVEHRIVQTALECRPCTHIGRATCPKGHFGCMRGVGGAEVAEAAWELLALKNVP